jgi:hypothetical protein
MQQKITDDLQVMIHVLPTNFACCIVRIEAMREVVLDQAAHEAAPTTKVTLVDTE